MNRKTLVSILLLVIICIFYTLFTIIHFKFQKVPAYCDGYWYLKVTENIAKSKGLVENVIIGHFPNIEKLKKYFQKHAEIIERIFSSDEFIKLTEFDKQAKFLLFTFKTILQEVNT